MLPQSEQRQQHLNKDGIVNIEIKYCIVIISFCGSKWGNHPDP